MMSMIVPGQQVGCPFCAGVHFEGNKDQKSRFFAEEIETNIKINQYAFGFENSNSPSHKIFIDNIASVSQNFVGLIQDNISAAFNNWSKILWSSAEININVEIVPNLVNALANGGSSTSSYYGKDVFKNDIWQQSASNKLITGKTSNEKDILIQVNASWIDRFEFDYSKNTVLGSKLDFQKIAMHEVAHALYSNGWRDWTTYEKTFPYMSIFDSNINNSGMFNGFVTQKMFGSIAMQWGYHYNYSPYSNNTGIMDVSPESSRWGKKYFLDFLDFTMARDSGLTTIFSDYVYMPFSGGTIDAGPGHDIATFKFIEEKIDIEKLDGLTVVRTSDGFKEWRLENFSFIELRDGSLINLTNQEIDLSKVYQEEFNNFYGIITIADVLNAIYRFYNENTGVHFLTTSSEERDMIISSTPTLRYEGVAFTSTANSADGMAIYRFFNGDSGAHFYTSSEIERNNVMADLPSFNYEGVAFYAHEQAGTDRQAVYRFYNTETGTHFYTASDSERDNVQTSLPSFNFEGVSYYVDIA